MPEELELDELLDELEEVEELELDEPLELVLLEAEELELPPGLEPLLLLPLSQADNKPRAPIKVARARKDENLCIKLPIGVKQQW